MYEQYSFIILLVMMLVNLGLAIRPIKGFRALNVLFGFVGIVAALVVPVDIDFMITVWFRTLIIVLCGFSFYRSGTK